MSDKPLASHQPGDITLGKFRLTPSGLEVSGEPTFEEWFAAFGSVRSLESCIMWWLGDLLNYGERRYGEMYTQAMAETGLAYQTLANAKWVASRVEPSRRRENLTFAHHAEVAALEPADQDRLLSVAHHERLTRAGLRQAIRDERDGGTDETPELCPYCQRPMPGRN